MRGMRAILWLLIGFLAGAIACSFWAHRHGGLDEVSRDTVRIVDTVAYYRPEVRDSIVTRYVVRTMPVHDTIAKLDTMVVHDSVQVVVPITQKRYEGEDYRAWVSGYEPSLDSIFVNHCTGVVTIRERLKPKRWGLGVQAGVGIGTVSRRIEPYVGVGVSYRIY